MKILVVSDEESPALWDHYRPGMLSDVDLILSAGDLKAEYLSFLVTMANVPLLYVRGNHDEAFEIAPPEGCECIDGRLVTVNGLRIMGLGGSLKYRKAPNQYTERQMAWRAGKLRLRLRLAGGLDILLTHAPARGIGDEESVSHRGFETFLSLMDRYRPRYLVHGHVHRRYGPAWQRIRRYGDTTVVNACGWYIIDTEINTPE